MTDIKAADLPAGSVVACGKRVYLESIDDIELPWIYYEANSMYVNHADDDEAQEALDEGAKVLRHGYGEGEI